MAYTESLDTVNEVDVVIGTATKEEAHQKGHIHRVVVVYVFSPEGDLYVQRVGKNKLYDHSVGGHVNVGESYDVAARREAQEELGIKQPLKFLGKLYSDESRTHNNYRHIYGIYESRVASGWKFTPTEEVKYIDALTLPKITELMNSRPELFTAGFLNTMKHYLHITHSTYRLGIKGYEDIAWTLD